MTIRFQSALKLSLVAGLTLAGSAWAADGDAALNGLIEQYQHRSAVDEWQNALMPGATAAAMARAAPSADQTMAAMLGGFTRSSLDRGHWTNAIVDGPGYAVGNPLYAVAPGAGVTGITAEGTRLAALSVQPLRSFSAYLAYLGQRMRADAGPPGALLQNDRGTDAFDRYIEEINYRIQTLYQAEDAMGR